MVRHGESEWNALGRWQGHADPPLSDLGIEQARGAAALLGMFDAVVSSDLQRARHTAELLAGELGIGPVLVEPRLRETHAAEWEGLTHAEIDEQWPGYLDAGRRPPGFESYDDTAVRASAALFDLREARVGATVLVVSHSGTIRSLRHRWGSPGPRLPNLAGMWFDVHSSVITVGDEVHLLRRETLADTD
jgi:probable phosphoglycerate mutase